MQAYHDEEWGIPVYDSPALITESHDYDVVARILE
jgi:hypothetical protein